MVSDPIAKPNKPNLQGLGQNHAGPQKFEIPFRATRYSRIIRAEEPLFRAFTVKRQITDSKILAG